MRLFLSSIAVLIFISGCAKAPVTGRSQFIMVSPSQEMQLGLSESQKILKNSKISTDRRLTERVRRIGERIAAISGQENYAWEFNVIEEDVLNAFCLPGGKVFFYTGILKIMENDDQIAAVMGHEIAHALARHGAERMSIQTASNFGAQVLALALNIPPQYQALYAQAYGMTSQIGLMLPFSRQHEHEADQIGVYLMYAAGYNMHEAVTFWERMKKASEGKAPPEFLSTHPSNDARIKEIGDFIKVLESQPKK
jgi:predicted Zn-dependent protease